MGTVAKTIAEHKIEIVATERTCDYLASIGVEAKKTSSITGFDQMLEGKIKTLHPAIHEMIMTGDIEIVIVDLMRLGSDADALEKTMDLGGIALIRTGIKFHSNVCVAATDGARAAIVRDLETHGRIRRATRLECAVLSQMEVIRYETAIGELLKKDIDQTGRPIQ